MPPPFHHHRDNPKCPKCGRRLAAKDAACIYCSGNGMKIIKRLLALLVPYKRSVIFMILLNVLGVAISLAPPYLTKRVIDDVILAKGDNRLSTLLTIFAAMAVLALLRVSVTYFGGVVSSRIGAGIVCDLRERLHNTLQRLQLKFFGNRNSGEYTGRIMHDTEEIQRFLVDGSSELIIQIITMFGILGVLFSLNWKLTLIVFLPVIPMVWLSNKFHHKIHAVFHDQGTGIAKLNTHITETINGIRTIKVFSQEDARNRVFNETADDVASIRVDITKKFLTFSGKTNFLLELTTAFVWLTAGYLIIGGDNVSVGDLMAFMGYIAMFYGPIRWLTHVVNHMVNALVSAERIFFVLDAPCEDEVTMRNITLSDVKGDIEIRDLTFAYEEGKDVLKGLSLHVKPGEMVGLVGHSGVGKSTLINLICRFYTAQNGEILIDGVNVNDLNHKSFRGKIGMVLQESFLFNASIRDNIACSKPDASDEEVISAAKAAGAHDFIAGKEDGYNTVVGEGGALLSGGEKQRIAIARAILHNPPILILDEATSSVDTETEQLIRRALATLCKGRTVIAIAHRLSTLRNADRIAVIDDGKVAELGTHEELIAVGGIYSRLVAAQTELNKIKTDIFQPPLNNNGR